MGLIDVLTQYDTKKKAAHAAKTVKHGVSVEGGQGLMEATALITSLRVCVPGRSRNLHSPP